MFVCICKGVTDSKIVESTKNGAKNIKDLKQDTGLGTCCGLCIEEAKVIQQTTQISTNLSKKLSLIAKPA